MERIAAGGVVFFTLIVLADVPTTSALAVAFAYIILIGALMSIGPVAFGRVSRLVNGTGGAGGTGSNVGGGSGGYHAKP